MPATPERPDQAIPKRAGTYALILFLSAGRTIQVGKLGTFDFPAGYYIYVGSAFGPGGLAGRLGRHLAATKADSPLFWHIDYLRRQASIVAAWFAEEPRPHQLLVRREHEWAALISRLPGSSLPAARFGASDCRCPSHLYHFALRPSAGDFRAASGLDFLADQPLHVLNLGAQTID